jgi:hypothetical protein
VTIAHPTADGRQGQAWVRGWQCDAALENRVLGNARNPQRQCSSYPSEATALLSGS